MFVFISVLCPVYLKGQAILSSLIRVFLNLAPCCFNGILRFVFPSESLCLIGRSCILSLLSRCAPLSSLLTFKGGLLGNEL